MQSQVLYPENVYAYRIGNEPEVVIVATGHEDGFTNIRIEASLLTIYPPVFMVVGDETPAIGYFPYTVKKVVPYATDLNYIQFQMANGTQKIPVTSLEAKSVSLAATQGAQQVVGYAYNSTDINVAIQDAVSKLRKLSPDGNIAAQLTSSGFVAAGSPVGIAYYYVVMQQAG